MALARLISRGQAGLDAYEVSVEVHLAGGLPGFTITGLPTGAVRESKDRVRAALQTCGFTIPPRRITVHLGPADVPKDGGRFDLAIALALIKAHERPEWQTDDSEFIGELSLGGELKAVTGSVPAALAARRAKRRLVLPADNGREVGLIPDAAIYRARHLLEVADDLSGGARLERVRFAPPAPVPERPSRDLADVRGQQGAKRALTIAAAGAHNLLMIGPPGSGKSMLAERLVTLLPPLDEADMFCVASIASIAGDRDAWRRGNLPPFRSPHHTTPALALIGGGSRPRPGEVSLAHCGVLFLDELPEFSRDALESLREPIETGVAQISRVRQQIRYPAAFQLVAAMNPCPCGHFGDGTDRCQCAPTRVGAYRARVSGPLLDRFDLHIEVPQVSFPELAADAPVGLSEDLRRQVAAAQDRQRRESATLNAKLSDSDLWRSVRLGPAARELLARSVERWQLSARSTVRVLKVAKTIADLDGSDEISDVHVAEALQLRCLDRPR